MNPIYTALLREFAGHYARQAVRDGLNVPCCVRDTGRRLEILHGSALHYAVGANA